MTEQEQPDYGINFGEIELFDFDIDFDVEFLATHEDRYHNPPRANKVKTKNVMYAYAVDAAKNIHLDTGTRSQMITAGSFEFGDFLEALFVHHNIHTKKLSVSTLSMSDNNVDSFYNLINGGFVDELDLIVSDFFFAHERRGLVPYILQQLDVDNKFQMAVAGSHTKIAIFETDGGKKVCIYGSANLRSSGCTEQTTIEDNADLYEFYKAYHDSIINEYAIINKPIRNKRLWQVVQKDGQATTEQGSPAENQQQEDAAPDLIQTAPRSNR